MKTIAFFGGSFNPPHVGHAMVASYVVWTGLCDRVWVAPTYSHPLAKKSEPFDLRYLMSQRLAEDMNIGFAVKATDIEQQIAEETGQPSFTYNTLCRLRDMHPDLLFRPVFGADIVHESHRWRFWDEIIRDFKPIVLPRPPHPPVKGEIGPAFPAISSTEIREAIASNDPKKFKPLLTPGVLSVIQEYDLYPDSRGKAPVWAKWIRGVNMVECHRCGFIFDDMAPEPQGSACSDCGYQGTP